MGKVINLPDPERRSREPDSVHRNLADSAVIIILPIIRVERYLEVETPRQKALARKIMRRYQAAKAKRVHAD